MKYIALFRFISALTALFNQLLIFDKKETFLRAATYKTLTYIWPCKTHDW